MKKFINQVYGLYNTYAPNGSLQSFLELVNDYESYNELNLKFPNRESKDEFKGILNQAWEQFIIDRDVYRVSHYINEIEAILI